MIVHNLNVPRIAIRVPKADSPLGVDSYAPLAGAVTAEPLQAIAGRGFEKLYSRGRIDHRELSFRLNLYRPETPWVSSAEQPRSIFAAEGRDHLDTILRYA